MKTRKAIYLRIHLKNHIFQIFHLSPRTLFLSLPLSTSRPPSLYLNPAIILTIQSCRRPASATNHWWVAQFQLAATPPSLNATFAFLFPSVSRSSRHLLPPLLACKARIVLLSFTVVVKPLQLRPITSSIGAVSSSLLKVLAYSFHLCHYSFHHQPLTASPCRNSHWN